MTRTRLDASGTMYHERGRIHLDLPVDEATDLAMAFRSDDGFSRDMWALIAEAEAWIEENR